MKPLLSRRYATLQKQLAATGPVSQGSVAFQPPGSWRWTFKVQGKTACVALSEEQATQMLQAIENHKRVEEIVREMRKITQISPFFRHPARPSGCFWVLPVKPNSCNQFAAKAGILALWSQLWAGRSPTSPIKSGP